MKLFAARGLFALFSILFATYTHALVVLQDASIGFGSDYDTNVLLTEDEQSISRYTVTPRYAVAATQDQNRWYSNAAIRFQRSSDKQLAVDREDPTVNVGWDREYDRGSFGLIANYSKSSTRIAEFDGTGLVVNDGSSTIRAIGANWQHLLSERLSLTIGSRLQKTKFSGGAGFTGFLTKSVNSGVSYAWTENISPFIQFSHSELDANTPNTDTTKSQNYLLGSVFTISPNLNVSAAYGVVHISNVGNSEIGNASFNYFGERHLLSGRVERTVAAAALANFQAADRLTLGYAYELSERSRIGTDFTIRKNRSLNAAETRQLNSFYSRDLTDFWQMRLILQLRELENLNVKAHGETFGFTFTYNTPEF